MPEPPVGRDPGPDPAARPVERDGDPGDEQPEGDPHEALARVALGDEQRELAEVDEADRQVERPATPWCRRRCRSTASIEVLDRLAVRVRPDDPVRAAIRTHALPVGLLVEQELEAHVAARDAERGVRQAGDRVGHRDRRVPQHRAGGCRAGRGAAPVRTRSGGRCSRATDSGSLTRIVLRAISLAVLVDGEVGREVGRPGRCRSRAPRSRCS